MRGSLPPTPKPPAPTRVDVISHPETLGRGEGAPRSCGSLPAFSLSGRCLYLQRRRLFPHLRASSLRLPAPPSLAPGLPFPISRPSARSDLARATRRAPQAGSWPEAAGKPLRIPAPSCSGAPRRFQAVSALGIQNFVGRTTREGTGRGAETRSTCISSKSSSSSPGRLRRRGPMARCRGPSEGEDRERSAWLGSGRAARVALGWAG